METTTEPASRTLRELPSAAAVDDNRFVRAFARAAGAHPTAGNDVQLLIDCRENFPAWLAAIEAAERYVLFESYIVADDSVGRRFADALAARARAGVRVCVLYDWLGSTMSRGLWSRMRDAGVEVICFNPPSLDSPLAWLTRDHRKSIVVDGVVAFVSGLCISAKWEGNEAKRLEPWRDTGVAIRGPAVADVELAFQQGWTAAGGAPLDLEHTREISAAGNMHVRVIAGVPNAAGAYRTDLLVASLAREHLWLTDAYFVATAAYTQALRAAAGDGVDVRLLVPGASDIPAISPLSRAGYRPLLESGVRVFEWNGTMLHAKTAVADGRWSRVGSTNLNLASWMSNYELDVAIEDAGFAHTMAEQYEKDLLRATEVVLTRRNRVRRTESRAAVGGAEAKAKRAVSGSAGRAAAGAVSVGSALGAALTNRRALGPAEVGLLATMAVIALAIAIVALLEPRVLAYPIAFFTAWFGVAWGVKAWRLWRRARRSAHTPLRPEGAAPPDGKERGKDGTIES